MHAVKTMLFGTGVGAATAYFLDPSQGRRRRHVARDRTAGAIRGVLRRGERGVRHAGSEAYGLKQRVTHLSEEPKPQPNDATVARKVETEIFRDAEVPKGKINVNAEDGVVILRGEANSTEQAEELAKAAGEVQGVTDVESRLQVAG